MTFLHLNRNCPPTQCREKVRLVLSGLLALFVLTDHSGAVPSLTTHPADVSAAANSNVSFSASVAGAAPLSYRWRFKGTPLRDGGVFSGTATSTLNLTGIRNYHAGLYDVQVTDAGGTVVSAPARLTLSPISWPGHPAQKHIRAVQVRDNIAFVTSNDTPPGLSLLNIGDPANAVMEGYWRTSNYTTGVAVRGNYAYLKADNALQVLDISNPANPHLAGTFSVANLPEGDGSLVFQGDRLYVANRGEFRILDATNPANLSLLGSVPVLCGKVVVDGNYAYTIPTADVGPVSIIDVSDPAHPERVAWYDLNGWTGGIAKTGNLLYIANDSRHLLILDVTNPRNPRYVSNIYLDSFPKDVAIYKHYALVACYWWGLSVVDVSDPLDPQQVAFYQTKTNYGSASGQVENVTVNGDYAYLGTSYGLQILDMSEPANPRRVGGDLFVSEVAVENGTAGLVDSLSGLRLADITNPAKPVDHGGGYDPIGYARGVALNGDRAYLVEGGMMEAVILHVLDIGTRGIVRHLGACTVHPTGSPWNDNLQYDIMARDNHVYIGAGLSGFAIVDVSDPANPSLVARHPKPALGVALDGTTAIVACGNVGMAEDTALSVLNLSTLANPVETGNWNASVGYAYRVALLGSHAFLATGTTGLQVLDVSNRSEPFRLSNLPSVATDIALDGSRGYTVRPGRLRAIDLSDPSKPAAAFEVISPGTSPSLTVENGHAFVADGAWGLTTAALPTNWVQQSFTGSAAIILPAMGDGSPYPSQVSVAGISGNILAVRVILTGFTHANPDDVDLFLMSPSGRVASLISDAGGSNDLIGASLVFEDEADGVLSDSFQISSGSYKPANYQATEPLPPGGTGTIGTSLKALTADGVNGVWKLFASDDASNNAGAIQSWTLQLAAAPELSAQEEWRLAHFGSTENSGDGADATDYDKDGLPNLIEFAFGLNPTLASSRQLPAAALDGQVLVVQFSQPLGVSGITYGAEWSATLTAGTWAAVTDSDSGPGYEFKIPVSPGEAGFLRFRITSP